MTKFGKITHVEERLVFLEEGPTLRPKHGSVTPADPNMGVLSYLCAHSLTYRATIFGVHGNASGEGRVLGEPRHCMLHTCVARFVSDS